jgi:hypothetical protein
MWKDGFVKAAKNAKKVKKVKVKKEKVKKDPGTKKPKAPKTARSVFYKREHSKAFHAAEHAAIDLGMTKAAAKIRGGLAGRAKTKQMRELESVGKLAIPSSAELLA